MTKNSIAAVFGFICAVLLWETSASGDTVTGGTFSNLTVTGTSSGAELCVTIRTAAFNPKKHKIEKRDGVAYVDGRKVIGTDGSVPNINEIADMEILWNGKSIPVTHDMYAPIYNAHISPGLVNVAIDEKGEFALISFECGDATRELVWLIIGKTGAWHRFIKEIGS